MPAILPLNSSTSMLGYDTGGKSGKAPVYHMTANGAVLGPHPGGSSAYWTTPQTGGQSGTWQPDNITLTADPVYDASGKITGYQAQDGTLLQGTNGANQNNAPGSNPNDPNSLFTVLSKPKDPAVSAAASALTPQVTATNDATVKAFNDYLTEAKAAQGLQKDAIAKDSTAIDTTGYSSQLAAIIGQYAKQAGDINTRYKQANDTLAKQQQDVVASLGTINDQYATDANAVARNALDHATAQNSRFQLASGTPISNSGDMTNRAIAAYRDINLPVAQQIAQMKLAQQTGFVAPLNQQIYADQTGQLGYESGVAGTVAGMGTAAAGAVAQLKAATAGKTFAEAQAYLSQLGVPIQLQQQVLAGNIANVGALSQVVNNANFQGLAAPYTPGFATLPGFGGAQPVMPLAGGGGYTGGAPSYMNPNVNAAPPSNVTYSDPNSNSVAAPAGYSFAGGSLVPVAPAGQYQTFGGNGYAPTVRANPNYNAADPYGGWNEQAWKSLDPYA